MSLSDRTFSTIAAFLAEIGLPVKIAEIHHPTFLPGVHADSASSLYSTQSPPYDT